MLQTEIQDAHLRLTRLLTDTRHTHAPITMAAPVQSGNKLWIGTSEALAQPDLQTLFKDQLGGLPVVSRTMRFHRHGKQQIERPVAGGLKVICPDGGKLGAGSIGIIARRDDILGFVTSGHVVNQVGAQVYQPSQSSRNLIGEVTVISDFKGNAECDAAFCKAEYSRRETPTVNRIWRGFDADTQQTLYYLVNGSEDAAAGQHVTMSGMNNNTGVETGKVVAINATVRFEDGGTLTGQAIADYLSLTGDSGAPVFIKRAGNNVSLIGINVGGSVAENIEPSPKQPANQTTHEYAVFSPWQNVASSLGGTWVIS